MTLRAGMCGPNTKPGSETINGSSVHGAGGPTANGSSSVPSPNVSGGSDRANMDYSFSPFLWPPELLTPPTANSKSRAKSPGLFTGYWLTLSGRKIRRVRQGEYGELYRLERLGREMGLQRPSR